MLDAVFAARTRRVDADRALDRLDSLMAVRPPVYGVEFGNLIVARL